MSRKSIYAIAKETGVSPTTVSRVLNNNPKVAPATRQAVLDAIDSANFVPSIGKSDFENIGVFIGSYDADRYSVALSPYCSEIVNGLSAIFCRYNYALSLFPINAIPRSRDEFKLFCFKRHIGAAVFVNLSLHDTFISAFSDLLPIICIGTHLPDGSLPYIKADNSATTNETMDYLYELGHRNIALLNYSTDIQDHLERFDTIDKACQRLNIKLSRDNLIPQNAQTYDDLPYLLEGMIRHGVTALVCFDNQYTMRVMHILRSMNISIPEDVSIVGYDDYYFAQYTVPPLTAIRQPIYNLAVCAGQTLINRLRDENTQCNLSLEPQLIIRKSVGPAKHKA